MATNRFSLGKAGLRRVLGLPVLVAVLLNILFGAPGLALADFSYTVKAGDNLSKIAKNTGTTVDALVAANKALYPCLAKSPSCLQIGWVINIPGGGGSASVSSGPSTYTVAAGDSLAKIAKKLGVDFNALLVANKQDRPCLVAAKPCALQIGWVLKVPGDASVAADDPKAAVIEFVAALNAGDINRLKAVFPSELTQNSDDAELQRLFDLDKALQIKYEIVSLQVLEQNGDRALVAYTLKGTSPLFPDDPNHDTISGQFLLIKIDGQWKILAGKLDGLETVK